jgi:hypothetical protein
MSEASKHTANWRAQQREEGYQSVTVWIPGRIKELAVKLAFQQHQDLGVVVAEALQAYALAKGARPSTLVDMRRVEALIDQKIALALASPRSTPTPPPAEPPALPEGMRWCRNGHQARVGKECRECQTNRKQKSRKGKADKRRGELPI